MRFVQGNRILYQYTKSIKLEVIIREGMCGMASRIGVASNVEHFGVLEDPRMDRAKRHEFPDIIVITLCAVICGADNWV